MLKLHLSISLPASESDKLIQIFGARYCRRTSPSEVGVWIESNQQLKSAVTDVEAAEVAIESVACSLLPEFTSTNKTRLVRLVPKHIAMPLNKFASSNTMRSCLVTVPPQESILIASADQNVRAMYCGSHLLIGISLITQIKLRSYAPHQRVGVQGTTSVSNRLVEVTPTADRRVISNDCFRSARCRLCGGLCVFLSSILIEAEQSDADLLESSLVEYGYGHDGRQPLLLSNHRLIEPFESSLAKSFLIKPVFQVDSEAHGFFLLCCQLQGLTRSI
jgi:hypothetical protein